MTYAVLKECCEEYGGVFDMGTRYRINPETHELEAASLGVIQAVEKAGGCIPHATSIRVCDSDGKWVDKQLDHLDRDNIWYSMEGMKK